MKSSILHTQRGVALALTLIMLGVGSILIVPTLQYAVTALKNQNINRDDFWTFHALEAVTQQALWELQYDTDFADCVDDFGDPVIGIGSKESFVDCVTTWGSWTLATVGELEGIDNETQVDQVNRHGIDRPSYAAILGGGAVLDMASFAAAISHRSVRTIRIPTTVLSQDDSGVGVKNGVNLFGKKNFVGTFQPPFAVLNDIDFITTLEHRDKIAGVAEAVKVAVIRDGEFFQYLESNRERIAKGDLDALAHLIRRSAELHLTHIATSGDPFEMGSARPLDFGHWCAHKMEVLTHNRLRHGEAVALGMALDTLYSWKIGHITGDQCFRVIGLLDDLGFSLWEEELLLENEGGELVVLEGLREFREHLGGILHITLLRGIGDGFEVNEMDE